MRIYAITDIAGADATVAMGTGEAKWIQVIVSGLGTVRIGDSTAAIAKGLPVPTGAGYMFPPNSAEPGERYSLNQIYCYVPIGATVSIVYAV